MKKNRMNSLKMSLLLSLLIVATKMIEGIPWWSFVVPVLGLGIVLTLKKWKAAFFLTGFLTGFIVWIAATLYFHFSFSGDLLQRIGPRPALILLLGGGLVGGLLTGLAFYTGKALVADRKTQFTL